MRQRLTLFIVLLFFIVSVPSAELLAGGNDSTGYIITNLDTPRPYDLGTGDIMPAGDNVMGIHVRSSGSAFKDGGTITTDALGAHGVYVDGTGSNIDLNDVDILTQGRQSHGLRVTDNGKATMTGGKIETNNDNTNPSWPGVVFFSPSHGVFVESGSNVTLNDVDIVIKTAGVADAIRIVQNGEVTMNGGSIYHESFGASAVNIISTGATFKATDVDIVTDRESADGININDSTGDTNKVLIDKSNITTNGKSSTGIRNQGNYIEILNTSVVTNGDSSSGVVLAWGAEGYMENVTVANNGVGSYINSNALNIQNGAQLTLKSADISVADSRQLAIITFGNASDPTTIAGLESVYHINGGIYANDYVSIDITIADNSTFNGWASYTNEANSTMNLTLKGPNTNWNLFGDGAVNLAGNSYLTNLTLDGATVDYSNAEWGVSLNAINLNPGAGSTGGTFIMKTDILSQDRTDLLNVTGTSGGAHKIQVVGDASAATDGTETLILVKTADQSATFALTTGTVDYGAWRYSLGADTLNYGSGSVWQLYSTGQATSPASNAVNTFSGAYLLAYAETQTLIQRLGDLRHMPYLNGMWFRVHGGRFESNSRSFIREFDMKYGGLQIGYDREIEIKTDGTLYGGVMFGYSKGDLDYLSNGSGTVDSKTIGVYGTYIKPDGFYIDAVLKYQWMNNDFDSPDYALNRVTGSDVSTGGFGASLEAGKRFHVDKSKEQKMGWYVEPQAQLSYQRQDGGSFTASNGLVIGVDSFASMIGRLGTLIGYETDRTNFYVKASWVKEFDGDINIIANGVSLPESFGDNWLVYGAGVASKINERNSMYFDIERSSGGTFTQPWRVNMGWRIEF